MFLHENIEIFFLSVKYCSCFCSARPVHFGGGPFCREDTGVYCIFTAPLYQRAAVTSL